MSNDEPLQLRDFVTETIKHVIDGVVTAQEYAKSKNAVVNPQIGFHPQNQNVMPLLVRSAKRAEPQQSTEKAPGIEVMTLLA